MSAGGVSPNRGSVLLCWDQGQLGCGLNKVQLMEELAEEGRTACKCSTRHVEKRGCARTAVKRFPDVVVFAGAMMQERAGGCCAGAALQGREGGGQKEGAGYLMEKPGSKAVFQSRLWPRR